jgi:hypothetical protein
MTLWLVVPQTAMTLIVVHIVLIREPELRYLDFI